MLRDRDKSGPDQPRPKAVTQESVLQVTVRVHQIRQIKPRGSVFSDHVVILRTDVDATP